MAEAGHAHRDDVGLDLPDALVVHAPVVHNSRAEVIDDYIGDGNQLAGDFPATRVRHIDDRAVFATEQVPGEATPATT